MNVRHSIVAVAALALTSLLTPACASNVDGGEDDTSVSTEDALTKGNWSGFTDGQCVHGVYQFYLHRYGISLPGTCGAPSVGICETCGACEIWKSKAIHPPASRFNQYTWGTTMPQTYDIVVYAPRGGVYGPGHVAAVDHMASGAKASEWKKLYVMDSNWNGDEKKAKVPHTVTRAPYGIFRLKSLDKAGAKGNVQSEDGVDLELTSEDDANADVEAELEADGVE
ncbi:MAG TPA: CHAP domain-containing protein [Polyangiaceae bacterium]